MQAHLLPLWVGVNEQSTRSGSQQQSVGYFRFSGWKTDVYPDETHHYHKQPGSTDVSKVHVYTRTHTHARMHTHAYARTHTHTRAHRVENVRMSLKRIYIIDK